MSLDEILGRQEQRHDSPSQETCHNYERLTFGRGVPSANWQDQNTFYRPPQ